MEQKYGNRSNNKTKNDTQHQQRYLSCVVYRLMTSQTDKSSTNITFTFYLVHPFTHTYTQILKNTNTNHQLVTLDTNNKMRDLKKNHC